MDKLNTYLKVEAIKHGLCRQWTEEWSSDLSVKALVDKYKRGLDFCIKNDYPSRDYIDSHFDKEELRKNGLYHNIEGFDDTPGSDIYVVQHGSKGVLHFGGYEAATIWVMRGSKVDIITNGHAFVVIHVLDNSKVFVNNVENASVSVRTHSDAASVSHIGGVSVTKSDQEYK